MILRLSGKEFLKSFEKVPRVAISVIVKNHEGKFLLAKRSYAPFKGQWYLPGSYILKNEKLSQCFERILKDELGIKEDFSKARFIGVFENLKYDKRGHTIDLIYELESNAKLNSIEETKFFNSIPSHTFPGHISVLKPQPYK